MAEDIIRYDVLVQEALRSVVRKVLAEAARAGLPGEHHFYIAFDTAAPGVRLSSRIRQKYPEEMTVVLQHQFWDFVVTDTQFEVTLSFGGIAERLVVPFTAVKGFFDPSVQFGLQFDPARNPDAEGDQEAAADSGPKPALASSEGRSVAPPEKPAQPAKAPARASVPTTAPPKPTPDAEPAAAAAADKAADAPAADAQAPTAAVVSLDAFRKKT